MDRLVSLNRRELLKTTTGLLTGWVVAGSPLALIAPARAWAVDLTAFTSAEGDHAHEHGAHHCAARQAG